MRRPEVSTRTHCGPARPGRAITISEFLQARPPPVTQPPEAPETKEPLSGPTTPGVR